MSYSPTPAENPSAVQKKVGSRQSSRVNFIYPIVQNKYIMSHLEKKESYKLSQPFDLKNELSKSNLSVTLSELAQNPI